MYEAPRSPKKSTKKNNDRRAQRMDPTSQSHKISDAGMVNRVDAPNYKTKNNKSTQ
ncbi:hypothetical protein SH2C18_34480 [Clostridium sediminicola]|uniref:hypothetical protein n=1 Tax=Clostridium sediminicola TaxID=3114879 RepID=UPI0031F22105